MICFGEVTRLSPREVQDVGPHDRGCMQRSTYISIFADVGVPTLCRWSVLWLLCVRRLIDTLLAPTRHSSARAPDIQRFVEISPRLISLVFTLSIHSTIVSDFGCSDGGIPTLKPSPDPCLLVVKPSLDTLITSVTRPSSVLPSSAYGFPNRVVLQWTKKYVCAVYGEGALMLRYATSRNTRESTRGPATN